MRVERGVELVSLERADDGGHMLTLEDPARRRRLVRAGYVIGADGIRSRVRGQLGIATDGTEDLETRWGMLLPRPALGPGRRAPLRDLLHHLRAGGQDLHPGRQARPLGFATDSAEAPRRGPRRSSWVRHAAGDPSLPVEIERTMPVTFGIALAERFRAGSAFLIGDAAHRVTPRGGTGINTAIRDGFDLGWKLGWVLRGWADEALLESYERERRPVAEHNTMRSTRSDGSILGNTAGLAADIGGRVAHVWVERDGGLVSTIDLLGDGLTLFVGPEHDGAAPGGEHGGAAIAVERLDAIAARALGLGPGGALLARPDGYPLAVSNDGSPEASNLEARRRSHQPHAAITAPAYSHPSRMSKT